MRKGSTVQVKIDKTEFPSVGIGDSRRKENLCKECFSRAISKWKSKEKKRRLCRS